MPARAIIYYGGVPVPYTVSWSDEELFFLGRCPYSQKDAMRQPDKRGSGKPRFGKPHSDRQREVIALDLCDLCARPLKNRTKVSLSHAKAYPHGAEGWAVLQVEPMLHKECAAESVMHCPSLRRDVEAGSLMVRHVTRWRVQFAIMDEIYTEKMTGKRVTAIGHAKVELLRWVDREASWLLNEPDRQARVSDHRQGRPR